MADFELRKDSKGEWYWRFQANNNKVIARSSESYVNRSDCLHSIRLVKEQAPGAPVYDMTKTPPERVDNLP